VIKPPRLRRGDTIGLVAPASGLIRQERLDASIRYLEGQGYRVAPGKHLLASHGAFGGTDEQRAADLNDAIRNPKLRAIFAVRGGYGSPRILSLVDYAALRRSPKIVVGFSDITALQLAIYRRCGLVTFSGPLPGPDFSEPVVDSFSEENFWRLLTSSKRPGLLPNPEGENRTSLVPGSATGPLLGGCLTMVVQVLGTRFCPSFRGSILVLEDVNEEPYRVDRMLTHLANAGIMKSAAGFAFGQWPGCEVSDPKTLHIPVPRLLREAVQDLGKPAFSGLGYGHTKKKLTIPFGLPARLDTQRNELRLLEAAVA